MIYRIMYEVQNRLFIVNVCITFSPLLTGTKLPKMSEVYLFICAKISCALVR